MRKSIKRLMQLGIVSAATSLILPVAAAITTNQLAYSQQQSDLSQEVLKLAQAKVQAATNPGAFGHGVPILNSWISGIDITSMLELSGLIAVIVTATGIGGAIMYYIFRKKGIIGHSNKASSMADDVSSAAK
jgi:hypothetical protein